MIDKLAKRVKIFAAYAGRKNSVRGIPFSEALHSTFQIYGLKKWLLKRRATIERVGDLSRFSLEGRTVYWPGGADVDRLVDMYFEVNCANAHQFDCVPTQVLASDVVMDVGCCEGFFAIKALEEGASRVYCFEPGRAACRALTKTFEKPIREGQIEIVGMLVGDTPGVLWFREDLADPSIGAVISKADSADEHCYRIPVTTLDEFVLEKRLERVDFLKVDVEGYELKVLRGGVKMIEKFSPKIAIAVYHHPEHAVVIRSMLKSIDSRYKFEVKGLVEFNEIVRPVMLHCYF
jgi:FkbM family methyltransferase